MFLPTLCIQPQCGGSIQSAGKSADAPCCLFSMTIIYFFLILVILKSRVFLCQPYVNFHSISRAVCRGLLIYHLMLLILKLNINAKLNIYTIVYCGLHICYALVTQEVDRVYNFEGGPTSGVSP